MTVMRLLGRLGMVLGGCVLGLLLAEVGMRLRAPSGASWMSANSPALYDTSIFVVDEDRRLLLKPNSTGHFQTPEFTTTVNINGAGLRGSPPRSESQHHVLLVGDSFTLGVQVEDDETFAAQIEAILQPHFPDGIQVHNGGVDSHGTWDALEQIRRVNQIQPLDAVVLTFFLGNDLWDNCNHSRRRLTPGAVTPPPPTPWLRRYSHLYTTYQVWNTQRQLRQDPGQMQRHRQELAMFAGMGLNREVGCSRLALKQLASTLGEQDIPGIVGLAPPVFVIDTQRLKPTFDMAGLDANAAMVDAPTAAVAQVVPDELITVDLTPPLRAHPNPSDLYFHFDGHWTSQGHRVVAEAYATHLLDVLQ